MEKEDKDIEIVIRRHRHVGFLPMLHKGKRLGFVISSNSRVIRYTIHNYLLLSSRRRTREFCMAKYESFNVGSYGFRITTTYWKMQRSSKYGDNKAAWRSTSRLGISFHLSNSNYRIETSSKYCKISHYLSPETQVFSKSELGFTISITKNRPVGRRSLFACSYSYKRFENPYSFKIIKDAN